MGFTHDGLDLRGGVMDDHPVLGDACAAADLFERLVENVARVLLGNDEAIRLSVTCLVAGGHLLVEDVPGVGKTSLGKALSASVSCRHRRVQFTSDLLPSDVTGVAVFDVAKASFEFKPGPIFANIVLGDEINRTPPKTQSALLEAMEERQVTVDGITYRLPEPFMVIATQNPLEHEGTFPLPMSQLDRFLLRIQIGYPDAESEVALLETHGASEPLDSATAGCHARGRGGARRTGPEPSHLNAHPRLHRGNCERHPRSPGRLTRDLAPGSSRPAASGPGSGGARGS